MGEIERFIDGVFGSPRRFLRDLFALGALAGILSDEVSFGDLDTLRTAERAYEYADAMLKAREQKEDEDE